MVQRESSSPPKDLREALWSMLRSPVKTLVPPWSWKAAVFTAILRSLAFFITNLGSGPREATKAMVVEAVYAVFAAGLIGAISQQLRDAEPLWATAMMVWAGLPGLMLLAQAGIHRLAHTPHLSGGLVVSFLFSSVAAAFTWYAMRHGAMLGGDDETSVMQDLRALPGISRDFLLVGPRVLRKLFLGRGLGDDGKA